MTTKIQAADNSKRHSKNARLAYDLYRKPSRNSDCRMVTMVTKIVMIISRSFKQKYPEPILTGSISVEVRNQLVLLMAETTAVVCDARPKAPGLAFSGELIWRFPQLGCNFLGVPIIMAIVFWGLYWGPSI